MSRLAAAKAISLLWIGTVGTSALALGTQVILARNLGPIGFGNFVAAIAVINLITPCVAFGVPSFWLRVFGEEGGGAKRWLIPSFEYIALSFFGVMLLLSAWVLFGPNDAQTQSLTLTLAPMVLAQAMVSMTSAQLQILGKYKQLTLWECAPNFLRFLLILAFAFAFREHLNPQSVAFVYLAVAILTLFRAMRKLMRIGFPGSNRRQASEVVSSQTVANQRNVFKGSWKFGLAGLLYIVYYQVNVVMLKYISGEASAGVYGAAYLIIGAAYTVPGVIFQKYLLPKLHKWQFHEQEKLRAVLIRGTAIMGVLGVAAAGCIILISEYLLPALLGSSYADTAPILWILALAVPLRFASTSAAAVMVSETMLVKKVLFMGVAALANILMNLFLIPRYGGSGAAWATVGTEAIMLVLLLTASLRYFFLHAKK